MTTNTAPTRRTFLKGGALLAAPLAAGSVAAVALAGEGLKDRVARLEDQAAIRDLHQAWLRQLNAAEGDGRLDSRVRRVTAHHAGAPDRIELTADGRSAVGYFDCAIEVETPLARDSTLAQMAHVQGHGAVRRTARGLLTVSYARASGTWRIQQVTWAAP